MPLFVNRNQMFAHQVHLLEHKLRSKEERILELETKNAILHLRLAESLSKLRYHHEEASKAQKEQQNHRLAQEKWRLVLTKQLSEVQLKQGLREVFAVYVKFATEFEEQRKQLLKTRITALEHSLQEETEKCRAERQRRKEIHNTLELRGNIRVHCRVRPVLPFDHIRSLTSESLTSSEEVVHAISDDTVMVNCLKSGMPVQSKIFEFEVHVPQDSQDAVFEEVKPLLTSLLDYNVCIMAYGQTGSGKTHTMMGSFCQGEKVGIPQETQQGIIPNAAAELFRLISEKPEDSHSVEVSVMEVYNNEVYDLLAKDEQGNPTCQRCDIITTSSGISDVPSLTSACEMMLIISNIQKLRAHCPNLVHTESSRSHLIVTLTVSSKSPNALALRRLQNAKRNMQRSTQQQWWSPRCRRANITSHGSSDKLCGSAASSPCLSPLQSPCLSPRPSISQTSFRTRLRLVDLAGSESVMSGVSGAALWEVSCINRSLSALSDVLSALAEQRPHIPYRNSKLTHVLQDAIGDAKLLVMLCVSPTQRYITESLQTLGLGTRARQVQKAAPRKKNSSPKAK
uniref:Kinesin family member 25 n=1 Tax=Cynoglossus semilaevis TaxID=244447 RepID=A0A3P8X505_CYNSE